MLDNKQQTAFLTLYMTNVTKQILLILGVTCRIFPDGEYCLMQWPYGPFPTSVIHTVGFDEAASAKNIPWGISNVVVFQDIRKSPSVVNTSTLGTLSPGSKAKVNTEVNTQLKIVPDNSTITFSIRLIYTQQIETQNWDQDNNPPPLCATYTTPEYWLTATANTSPVKTSGLLGQLRSSLYRGLPSSW